MTIPMINATVKGYQERIFDLQRLTVMTGYYTAYFAMSKKPKPVGRVLEELDRSHQQSQGRKVSDSNAIMEAKVAEFQRREENLRRFLDGQQSES